MILDFHMHAFPDSLAPRAMEKLKHITQIPTYSAATVSDTLAKMKAAGIDRGVLLHIATNPRQQDNVNAFAIESNQGDLISFGSVHFENDHAIEALQMLKEHGVKGVKLHPDYQNFFIDDPRLFPIYEAISDLGLIVTFHAGFDGVSPNVMHCPPKRAKTVLQRFPHMKVVLAHMGGFKVLDEVLVHLAGENVYFDTSLTPFMEREACIQLFRRHPIGRFLFGSDLPWQDNALTRQFIEELPLTKGEKAAIFYDNAASLLRL